MEAVPAADTAMALQSIAMRLEKVQAAQGHLETVLAALLAAVAAGVTADADTLATVMAAADAVMALAASPCRVSGEMLGALLRLIPQQEERRPALSLVARG